VSTLLWYVRVVGEAFRAQLTVGRDPGFILGAVITPPLYTVVFVLIAQYVGRHDLAPFAVLGPALMGLWWSALLTSGEVVTDERWAGTLELLVAAPAPAELVIVGRVLASALLSLVAVPETLAVAAALGMPIGVADPVLFAAALSALALSGVTVGLIMASTFVLARSTRLFQNVLAFPFYIVSGVAFPVAVLPAWLQPLGSVVALSWGAELLRGSVGTTAVNVPVAFAAIAVLTVAYAVVGHRLFVAIERRVRLDGTLASY